MRYVKADKPQHVFAQQPREAEFFLASRAPKNEPEDCSSKAI
jgi:hypothetical protein